MDGRERSDEEACAGILARGSKSFALAALLLPRRVRGACAALYAFCRVADDLIDDAGSGGAASALEGLRRRLDAIVIGAPHDDPVDRALARVVAAHALPRQPLDALLEGFEWDVRGRRYQQLEDVYAYAARVAGSVGILMTLLFGCRDRGRLARACDLGIAMQLTNIARDVGEDARQGRLYLPRLWLVEDGLDIERWLARPTADLAVKSAVARLLAVASTLYQRSDVGVDALPRDVRPAVRAARLVYAEIDRVIADRGFDTVSSRAFVSKRRKAWLVGRAMAAYVPSPREIDGGGPPPLDAARFLVTSAALS